MGYKPNACTAILVLNISIVLSKAPDIYALKGVPYISGYLASPFFNGFFYGFSTLFLTLS